MKLYHPMKNECKYFFFNSFDSRDLNVIIKLNNNIILQDHISFKTNDYRNVTYTRKRNLSY